MDPKQTNSQAVAAVLPRSILDVSNFDSKAADKYVQNLVQCTIPRCDQRTLKRDLGWAFLLDAHSFQKKSSRRRRPFLTRKQRSKCGLLKLPKEGWDYGSLQPMRDMWKDYMRRNLELTGKAPSCVDQEWASFSLVAAKSELIGAELKVVRSKVVNQVGMCGTLVLETKLTFQIVTPQSKLKTIIKETSVFEFRLDNLKFTVYGKHIATRPAERSAKKIKNVMNPDL